MLRRSQRRLCDMYIDSDASQSAIYVAGRLICKKRRQANEKVWLMFHIPPGIDPFSTSVYRISLNPRQGSIELRAAA